MKKLISFLFSIILTANLFAQHIVTAPNGLILRSAPKSGDTRIGKLPFGTEVEIIEKTDKTLSVKDGRKTIRGNWVKIRFVGWPGYGTDQDSAFVFDGYLKTRKEVIYSLNKKINSFSQLKGYSIAEKMSFFHLKGDFFGDGVSDLALLVEKEKGEVKLCFINNKRYPKVHLLGMEDDPFSIGNYNWAGIFERVNRGKALWSNYEDDFIDFEDIPESKKVYLKYDALFAHNEGSCGGGFIYWKDGKFNWLQQE